MILNMALGPVTLDTEVYAYGNLCVPPGAAAPLLMSVSLVGLTAEQAVFGTIPESLKTFFDFSNLVVNLTAEYPEGTSSQDKVLSIDKLPVSEVHLAPGIYPLWHSFRGPTDVQASNVRSLRVFPHDAPLTIHGIDAETDPQTGQLIAVEDSLIDRLIDAAFRFNDDTVHVSIGTHSVGTYMEDNLVVLPTYTYFKRFQTPITLGVDYH